MEKRLLIRKKKDGNYQATVQTRLYDGWHDSPAIGSCYGSAYNRSLALEDLISSLRVKVYEAQRELKVAMYTLATYENEEV